MPEIDAKIASGATGQPRDYGDDDRIGVVVCPDRYEESNGLGVLQRDDPRDNTRHGLAAADTLIF